MLILMSENIGQISDKGDTAEVFSEADLGLLQHPRWMLDVAAALDLPLLLLPIFSGMRMLSFGYDFFYIL